MHATELAGNRLSLGSVLCGYPGPHFADEVLDRSRDIAVSKSEPSDRLLWEIHDLLGAAGPDWVDALRCRYIQLFERGAGPPLVESDLDGDRRLRKTRILADVAGFYLAFGLTGKDALNEAADHLAVELEFCAWLQLKEAHLEKTGDLDGTRIVRDARCHFLSDHLGVLAAAVAQHPAVQMDPFYGKAFGWTAALVAEQCRAFGINLEPFFWTGETRTEDKLEESCSDCGAAAECPIGDKG